MTTENRWLGVTREKGGRRLIGVALGHMALVAALGALACAPSPPQARIVVTGIAEAAPDLTPGDARLDAFEKARRNAYLQLFERVSDWSVGERTVQDLMDSSPYVASRVRGAIQRAEILDSRFDRNGRAEVVVALDPLRARAAALAAEAAVE